MPIAKEPLRIGNIVVASVGHYVNPQSVDRYGWHDKVDPDDGVNIGIEPVITVQLPDEEPVKVKGRRRKGA